MFEAGPILCSMLAHVCWVVVLYMALTIARAPSVWGVGLKPEGTDLWKRFESRVSANLSNQFEWPVLFYAAGLLGILTGVAANASFIVAAWIFVGGRILHSLVQILGNSIRLRGIVFTVNFLAVLAMWFQLVLIVNIRS
ncbi:MAG: MAPEG family protein [Pseudomonadota bacterium]